MTKMKPTEVSGSGTEHETHLVNRIEQSLQKSDDRNRLGRARRILWKAQFESTNSFWMDLDTAHVFDEAKNCFVDGHFVATVVLATAFMEHTLSDLLDVQHRASLEKLIKLGSQEQQMPQQLLERLDRLRLIRNPFTHRKLPNDRQETLGHRSVEQGKHPQAVLEEDAKEALSLLYAFFPYAVREGVRDKVN